MVNSRVQKYQVLKCSGVVTGVWRLERIGCERLWLDNFEDLPEACLFCIVDVEHKGFGGDSGCTKVNGATGYCMVAEELCVRLCWQKDFLVE